MVSSSSKKYEIFEVIKHLHSPISSNIMIIRLVDENESSLWNYYEFLMREIDVAIK